MIIMICTKVSHKACSYVRIKLLVLMFTLQSLKLQQKSILVLYGCKEHQRYCASKSSMKLLVTSVIGC